MTTALITGASQGLGRALLSDLVGDGWRVIVDARHGTELDDTVRGLNSPEVTAIPGDINDPAHRAELATAVGERLDLLVLNASTLGTTPLPALADYDLTAFGAVFTTNVVSQLALLQQVLPALRNATGRVVALSSDAAVAAYEGWGAYGSSKAALDHLIGVFAAEEPKVRAYAFDPGDMRTAMHQAAFPGEDISDRPLPETVVPALRRLVDSDRASGRYTVGDFS
ncbi:MAG TPA: SDR family NAD(P)-dependent oxidoreductase [Mycobacteriales bacterium]|nr:SDR family NAD(P)-dependent oxidoreductase [Mycobacteriales bacterium]